ncbi:MAG: AarF/UbiB family protein [Candidatus Omnitrophica bacterium]|nr:AarF/UbiB family protein [Candidatus Omnitrophota bacterium]MCM8828948.1 AarF/UbiB family protein [Candidatus Omnitrophota bacterium]
MNILGVSRKYRLINRVRIVLRVLVKHGLGYFLDRIFKEPSLRVLRFHRISAKRQYLTPAQRLCSVIEELGPTYIKIGQFFSTRADILPENFLKELSKLQDNVSPFPFEKVEKTINEDFERPMHEIFSEFSEKPMFSASIGQVHFARLVSGETCVVKVRRPGVEEAIAEDVEVLTEISKLAAKHIPELKKWNISELLEEVGEFLKRQIDFIYEAGMMEKLKDYYGRSNIMVPRVFWDFTSKRVLTMEKIHGIKILDVVADKSDVSSRLVKGLFETLFETGYFHADLHPGNILITDKGGIAFVDFGLVGYFSFEKRKLLAAIISGVLKGKTAEVIPHIKKLFGISYKVPETFERDVGFIVDKYGSLPLKKVHLANIIYDLMRMARKMSIRLDSDVGLLAKNLMSLEAICARLSPSESMLDLSKTYWQPLLDKGIFQHLWLEDIKNVLISYKNIIMELPETWEEFVGLNRERVETEQKISRQLEKYTRSIEHAGTKISFAIFLLPVLAFIIISGIKYLRPGMFILLLTVFIVLIAILLKMTTQESDE